MTDLAIETTGLTKRYGEARGIVDVDLHVPTGEIFGFIGPNGSGKSTTIRLLLDLIRPTAGSASVLGLDCQARSVEIRRRIGYVAGELALYRNQTGRQAIDHFASLRRLGDTRYADELAERFRADLTRPIGKLSTGNKQKIGVIVALMHKPELLILDEPSTGLDPLVQQDLQEVLREVRADGRTVFLSSHTLSEVDRVTDRVGIIREGRLIVVERLADLKARATRHLEFEFASPVPGDAFTGVDGVRDIRVDGRVVTVAVEGDVDATVRAATAHRIVDIRSIDADLEDIFLTYYRDRQDPTIGTTSEVGDVG